jgi:hypothetical protein
MATAEVRAAIQSRVVKGRLRFKILEAVGEVVGTWGRVSQGRKSNFVMRFGGRDWRGEQFIFDGDKASYAIATSTHQRSGFATFVSGHDFIVKEGLLGGELSTAWALQNLDKSGARVEEMGRTKIDGRELLALEYVPKSGSDMTVKLYFEPETFRHVMSVYSVKSVPLGVTRGITRSAQQQEREFTIEERFSEFQTVDGVTLPHLYKLQFSEQLQNGRTLVYEWTMTADQILDNVSLDPANFDMK